MMIMITMTTMMMLQKLYIHIINPLTPMSDQD